MIAVQDVNKIYPPNRQVLHNVSLELVEGDRLILLGPNGAGKTTLIRCITGLTAPDSGSIYVNGVDVVRHPDEARESIAVVFEEADNSYSYLTVLENLLYFGLLNKWSRAEAKRRAERMMAVLNLTPYAERLTQTLSRGMKQKLAFAIALMKGAPFLFLDEPTLGLDVESQHHIRTMLTEENQWWKAVLITTHDIPFAHAVGNKFVFIQGGKIVWSGTKEHFSTPADLETHFLAAIRSNLSV
ncbi:ATP-binding cassette domain-containing protein [Geobacillus thermoleovorans]|uniref:ABC transporter ATP-binding protein n=1 Tax=Geobacillus thermoleovorans TaxID=33941 RepID=UPI00205A6374|nr:ABC transporter ATP-binding protein [Geobacillus thermoleovorans]UPT58580.1 ATP-binding cassette domain-containing protein [Geobacillus thermoleovorans]